MKNTLIVLAFLLTIIASTSIHAIILRGDKPTPTDYQIICGNDTLILMDSTNVVTKIPYSDTSDIWKIIIKDNR